MDLAAIDKYNKIIAFVNGKSGGRLGLRLYTKLQCLLGMDHVFDLGDGGPEEGLKKYRDEKGLTIVACGGDGTVGWVLSSIDNVEFRYKPSVVPMPLGTGNDMSRVLEWGSSYSDASLIDWLDSILDAIGMNFDRWVVDSRELTSEEIEALHKELCQGNAGGLHDSELAECILADSGAPEGAAPEEQDKEADHSPEDAQSKPLAVPHHHHHHHHRHRHDRGPLSKSQFYTSTQLAASTDHSAAFAYDSETSCDSEKNGHAHLNSSISDLKEPRRDSETRHRTSNRNRSSSTRMSSSSNSTHDKKSEIDEGKGKSVHPRHHKNRKESPPSSLKQKLTRMSSSVGDFANGYKYLISQKKGVDINIVTPSRAKRRSESTKEVIPPESRRPERQTNRKSDQRSVLSGLDEKTSEAASKASPEEECPCASPALETCPIIDKKTQARTLVMNNYFSLGIDSLIALEFHKARKTNPSLFPHHAINKAWYSIFGLKSAFLNMTSKPLHKVIKLELDNKLVQLPKQLQAIVFLQIPSYGSGTNLWGDPSNTKNQAFPPRIDDFIFEVVGLKGVMHLSRLQTGLSSGIRIAQAHSATITNLIPIPVQCDGEPWVIPPCQTEIKHKNQSRLLFNYRNGRGLKKCTMLIGGENTKNAIKNMLRANANAKMRRRKQASFASPVQQKQTDLSPQDAKKHFSKPKLYRIVSRSTSHLPSADDYADECCAEVQHGGRRHRKHSLPRES
ncbi:diacylglycerol kinase 1-like [Schistocerca gregaria]|uniref:diacylglycerol kinase 1-like n=1 Tax=Schistocerca gregaria TaxID=7010 RepID=UPI00211F30C6|nr:diacylglycerol kinase 1-like [Schistocerca gregaria]XP_049851810.1 diacylglycerol kinase 1-like [Schistocerca gregaria]